MPVKVTFIAPQPATHAAPVPALALFEGVDLKSVQTIDALLPNDRRFVVSRVSVVPRTVSGFSAAPTVGVHPRYPNAAVAGTASAVETNLAGANNDLRFVAVTAGVAGDSITVAYVNPGTPSAALSVSAVGSAITVNLATNAGTAQVETATVGSGASASADVIVTVTGAGITGSPLAVNVAVTNGDTAAQVATKIRAALNATAAITALYTVGGTGADVTLTKTVAAANDGTLNVAIDGTTNSTGVADAASSANTTAGVAPAITSTAAQVKAALEAYGAAVNLITVANKSGNDGTGVVTAMTATALTGGADGSTGVEGSTIITQGSSLDSIVQDVVANVPLGTNTQVKEGGAVRLKVTGGATATTLLADVLVEGVLI